MKATYTYHLLSPVTTNNKETLDTKIFRSNFLFMQYIWSSYP